MSIFAFCPRFYTSGSFLRLRVLWTRNKNVYEKYVPTKIKHCMNLTNVDVRVQCIILTVFGLQMTVQNIMQI